MARKPRLLRKAIFIACEGANTEPNYFKRIKEELEHVSITIYPDRNEKDINAKSDGLGLVREAQARAEEFDELYVVLDKDGYTLHNEVLIQAAIPFDGKTVTICLTSIAFEHWVLLHFEKNYTSFKKSQNIIDHLVNQGFYGDYSKSGDSDIYAMIKGNTQTACINAAWLRTFQNSRYGIVAAHNYDAYTDVDHLITRLFEDYKPVSWHFLNTTFTMGSALCTLRLVTGVPTLSIQNLGTAIVFNPANYADIFSVSNETGIELLQPIDQTIVIAPNQTYEMEFNINIPNLNGYFVKVQYNNKIMYLALDH